MKERILFNNCLGVSAKTTINGLFLMPGLVRT
jgi:hypothetical protein